MAGFALLKKLQSNNQLSEEEQNFQDWAELLDHCDSVEVLKKLASSIGEHEPNARTRERLRKVYIQRFNEIKLLQV